MEDKSSVSSADAAVKFHATPLKGAIKKRGSMDLEKAFIEEDDAENYPKDD